MKEIAYVDIAAQWADEREDLSPIIDRVLAAGHYVGGAEVELFEESAKKFFGSKYVIGLNSGTDALVCSLSAVGVRPGDEVITPPNSFVASTAAVTHIGAKPVFVDVKPDQNIDESLIEKAISSKTRAIMPVHLTGRMASMDVIKGVADKYGLPIVEDAAQSAGSRLKGRLAGTWGVVGCFSAHPLKNLNACGDAGFVVTDDNEIAENIRSMRNHGLVDRNTVQKFGFVSRLDSIQAAILRYRLSRLVQVIEKRRVNVQRYQDLLDSAFVFHPGEEYDQFNSWHTFVIQVDRRDELREFLAGRGIETAIHYPIPIHLQPAARQFGYQKGDFPNTEHQATRILTLPVHQHLASEDIQLIAEAVNTFFQNR